MPVPDPQTALRTILGSADMIEDICARRSVGLLVAFGSAARDEPEPADLDLAYAAAGEAPVDVLGLLGDLVDLTGTDQIDLMDLDRAGVVAAQRATSRCVPVWECRAGAFAAMQLRAAMRFADTKWLRDLQLQALAAG